MLSYTGVRYPPHSSLGFQSTPPPPPLLSSPFSSLFLFLVTLTYPISFLFSSLVFDFPSSVVMPLSPLSYAHPPSRILVFPFLPFFNFLFPLFRIFIPPPSLPPCFQPTSTILPYFHPLPPFSPSRVVVPLFMHISDPSISLLLLLLFAFLCFTSPTYLNLLCF